jgi:hypothetical protein
VPQCRGGLAPAVSLKVPADGQAASVPVFRRVPWVAVAGSRACPVVVTACRCRRIAAAMMACAWAGLSLFCCLLVRYWQRPGRRGWRAVLPRQRARLPGVARDVLARSAWSCR